jgi:transglutaminase-like putative cysteine protease
MNYRYYIRYNVDSRQVVTSADVVDRRGGGTVGVCLPTADAKALLNRLENERKGIR